MAGTKGGLEFDPGFGSNVLALRGTVEYLYTDINRFKNFSQKKVKFLQYHKKFLEIFDNNVGFYTGCLMWAAYLMTQPEQKILSNPCYGIEYNEEENISDTQYILKFAELFPKDMKYFLGQSYEFEEDSIKLIKTYEEFLILNKGFTKTKLNTDLILPDSVKTNDAAEFNELIEKAVQAKDLAMLKKEIKRIL